MLKLIIKVMKKMWKKISSFLSLLVLAISAFFVAFFCLSIISVNSSQTALTNQTLTTQETKADETGQTNVINANNSLYLPYEYAPNKPYCRGNNGYLLTTKNANDETLVNLTYFNNDTNQYVWSTSALSNVMDIKYVQNSTSTPFFVVICETQSDLVNRKTTLYTLSADTGKNISTTQLPPFRSRNTLGLYQFSGADDNQMFIMESTNTNMFSRIHDCCLLTLNPDGTVKELKIDPGFDDMSDSSKGTSFMIGIASIVNHNNNKKYSIILELNSLNNSINVRIYEDLVFKIERQLDSIDFSDISIYDDYVKTLCNQFYISIGKDNSINFAWVKPGKEPGAIYGTYNYETNTIPKIDEISFYDEAGGSFSPILLNISSIYFSNNIFYISSTFTNFRNQEPIQSCNLLEFNFENFTNANDLVWNQNNATSKVVKCYTDVVGNASIARVFLIIPESTGNIVIVQQKQIWLLNPLLNDKKGGYVYVTSTITDIKTRYEAPAKYRTETIDQVIINEIEEILRQTDFESSIYSSVTNYNKNSQWKISTSFADQSKYKLRGEISFNVYLTECYVGGNLTTYRIPSTFVLYGFRGWQTRLKDYSGIVSGKDSNYEKEYLDDKGNLHLVLKSKFAKVKPEDYDINPLVDLLYKQTENFFVDLPENFVARDDIAISIAYGAFGKTKIVEIHLSKYVDAEHNLIINGGDNHFFKIIIDGLKVDNNPIIFVIVGLVCILLIIISIIFLIAKSRSDRKYERYIPMLEDLSSHDKWA